MDVPESSSLHPDQTEGTDRQTGNYISKTSW